MSIERGFDVRVSTDRECIVAVFNFGGMLHLSFEDAQEFYAQFGNALAVMTSERKAPPTGTESGMTELDCALMQPAPQADLISVYEADPCEPSEPGRDHAREDCGYSDGCTGCVSEAESLAEAERWNTATGGAALTDWERELLARAVAEDDGEDNPEDDGAAWDRAIADEGGAR
ncbi:hypothetical protein ABZ412_34360 [Nocardia sp. NPDC005746]|uniref:hypothetical protein n=1 Tax=Nocardia sp. NPDC005746 TaxID=3157062 RepID=UPI00340E99EB